MTPIERAVFAAAFVAELRTRANGYDTRSEVAFNAGLDAVRTLCEGVVKRPQLGLQREVLRELRPKPRKRRKR